MPYWFCGKCHHEWEAPGKRDCDWCGFTNPLILEKKTPLEKYLEWRETVENNRNNRDKKTR